MIINGKERKFRYNVWASGKIAKLTATGEIKDIMNEIQNDARAADLIPQIAIIMNTAFEKHKQMKATARGEDYATDILDISEINDLTVKESTDLMEEIFRTMKADGTGEIETEPVETGKKTEPVEKTTESR